MFATAAAGVAKGRKLVDEGNQDGVLGNQVDLNPRAGSLRARQQELGVMLLVDECDSRYRLHRPHGKCNIVQD